MTRRAVLLALLAAPAFASAQAAGTISFDPPTYINYDACTGGTDVSLAWTVQLESGVTFDPVWTYRVYASPTSPSGDTGAPKYCPEANKVGGDIDATGATQSETRSALEIVTAAGLPADCSTTTETTIYVCVHLYEGAEKRGSATGTLTLQLRAPAVPAAPTVTPGDTCLYVSWSKVEATSTTPAAAKYRVEVTTVNPADPVKHTETTTGSTATVCGLLNDDLPVGGSGANVLYDVVVIAISAGGNESLASPSTPGDPVPSDDFWEHYRNLGGQEEGGCSTGGGAGILALLGLVAFRAAARRRS